MHRNRTWLLDPIELRTQRNRIRPIEGGDGSALTLNFTTGVIDPRLNFQRSTAGTYTNQSGYLAKAQANEARFDWSNGVCRGILLEKPATNLVYHSKTFSLTQVASEPHWADSALMQRSASVGPDGVSGTAINFVSIGSAQTVIQTAAVGTQGTRIFSFWAKRTGGGTVEYTLDGGANWFPVSITESWVRYVVTATTADQRVGFRIATGAGTDLYGPQLEADSLATSYIETENQTASRGRDECTMTQAVFPQYFTSQTDFTMLVKYSMNQPTAHKTATDRVAFELHDATTGRLLNYAAYRSAVGDAGKYVRSLDQRFTTYDMILVTATAAVNTGFVLGIKSGQNILHSADNQTTTDADNMIATACDRMTIGTDKNFGTDRYINGCISELKYWTTRLQTAEIEALL